VTAAITIVVIAVIVAALLAGVYILREKSYEFQDGAEQDRQAAGGEPEGGGGDSGLVDPQGEPGGET
jgi:hypothetical protein